LASLRRIRTSADRLPGVLLRAPAGARGRAIWQRPGVAAFPAELPQGSFEEHDGAVPEVDGGLFLPEGGGEARVAEVHAGAVARAKERVLWRPTAVWRSVRELTAAGAGRGRAVLWAGGAAD